MTSDENGRQLVGQQEDHVTNAADGPEAAGDPSDAAEMPVSEDAGAADSDLSEGADRGEQDVGDEGGQGDVDDVDQVDVDIPEELKWQDYVFDPADVAAGAALINAASADPATAEYKINGGIIQAAEDAGIRQPLVRELACTYLYRLNIERNGAASKPGARLEPHEPSPNHYLRALIDVTDDVKTLWAELVGVVTTDRARARLYDLLFTTRHGNVPDHGRDAIAAYLAALPHADDHDRVEMLLRAWTIARGMRRHGDEAAVRANMWSLVTEHADQPNGGAPGATLPLLRALAVPAGDSTLLAVEPVLDDVLEDLAAKYKMEHLVDEVAGLQRKRADGDKTKLDELARRRVQARLDRAASEKSGQLRMHFYGQAAALARDLGLKDLENQAVTAMQNIKPEELEWARIRSSVRVPLHIWESYLRQFDEDRDWRVGLMKWFATAPPSGRYSDNVRAARDSAKHSVLRHLFGSTTYGAHGLPQQSSGPSAAIDEDVRRNEQHLATNYGRVYAAALDRIRALAPDVSDVELAAWIIETYGCDPALASRLARSLILFWEGRYDEAAHTVAPAIEAGVRSLLRELDEPLYRVEKGNSIGQFPGLGTLIPKLFTRGLDKSWQRYLEVVLLPDGHNLRNYLAHGLSPYLGRLEAVLMLRAAALVVLLSAPDSTRRDAQELEAELRRAPRPVPRTLRQRITAAVRSAQWELRRRDV